GSAWWAGGRRGVRRADRTTSAPTARGAPRARAPPRRGRRRCRRDISEYDPADEPQRLPSPQLYARALQSARLSARTLAAIVRAFMVPPLFLRRGVVTCVSFARPAGVLAAGRQSRLAP